MDLPDIDLEDPLDPDPDPCPSHEHPPHQAPQENPLDNATGMNQVKQEDEEGKNCMDEEDSSVWSGPSWWSWGPSEVSDHDYARDVWHIPEVYGLGYNGGTTPPRDVDYDIREDGMSQADYDALVSSYRNE